MVLAMLARCPPARDDLLEEEVTQPVLAEKPLPASIDPRRYADDVDYAAKHRRTGNQER
jgi:hypothetical protein